MGAKNAVTATILVQSGWTGLDEALEGPRTLFQARAQPAKGRSMDVPMALGHEILGSNIKKWCVGSPAQAPLDCVQALIPTLPKMDQIQSIVVEIRSDEAFIVDNRDMPNICLQHLVALYLVDRKLTFDSVHDVQRMEDPKVREARSKIQLVASESLMKSGGRQAIVTITTNEGQTLNKHVQHVRGTWGDPMPRSEIHEKAKDLLEPVLGAASADALLSSLWNLENLDASALDQLIQSAQPAASL
jgi:2-methylcitrate dehydratase PrpD